MAEVEELVGRVITYWDFYVCEGKFFVILEMQGGEDTYTITYDRRCEDPPDISIDGELLGVCNDTVTHAAHWWEHCKYVDESKYDRVKCEYLTIATKKGNLKIEVYGCAHEGCEGLVFEHRKYMHKG